MHIQEIQWDIQIGIMFLCGLVLAISAHARKNYITLAILALHMGIEWFEWSQEVLSMGDIAFNLLHITMDFIFLSHELRVHAKRYRTVVLASVSVLLVMIFCIGHTVSVEVNNLKYLEPFVIAGVLGCILSHIYFHIKKE